MAARILPLLVVLMACGAQYAPLDGAHGASEVNPAPAPLIVRPALPVARQADGGDPYTVDFPDGGVSATGDPGTGGIEPPGCIPGQSGVCT